MKTVFLLIASVFGLALLFCTPPLQVADEQGHFFRAYDISKGHLIAKPPIPLPKTLTTLITQYPPRLEVAWGEYRSLTLNDVMHSLHEDLRPDDTVPIQNAQADIYTFVPYIPAALGIFIARTAGASALGLMYAGRFFNLLAYTCLIYLALRKLPRFHLPFLLIALMPMSLQQAASLSADAVTISVTLLYLAVILSLCCADNNQPLTVREYGPVLLLGMIVVLAKANVAVVLLPLIVHAARFGGTKKKFLLLGAYVLGAYLPFTLWQYLNRTNLDIFQTISLQAGVDIPANIAFLKQHPLAFLGVLLRSCQEHWRTYLAGFVGVVGAYFARLPSWITYLYLFTLMIVSTIENGDNWLTIRQRLVIGGIVVVSVLSVFAALWAFENQQTASATIAGVQGRYFITIVALAITILPSGFRWRMNWQAGAILSAGVILIAAVGFWNINWQTYFTGTSDPDARKHANIANLSNVAIFWGGSGLLQAEDTSLQGCRSFHFLGHLDTIPLLGDWNGDGRTKVGIYHKGVFYLDYNGNGKFDGSGEGLDRVYRFTAPLAGDVPIVGDWNGDGRTKIGIFRNGFLWILDHNGNGKLDDPPSPEGDRVFALGGFPMDLPVVGDWTGDGHSKVGIYRHGTWILQAADSLTTGVKTLTERFADNLLKDPGDCDIPIVGDWNGAHKTQIGMLLVHNQPGRARTYEWVLDPSGKGSFNLGGEPGDVPVIGNFNGGRRATVGVYRRGNWILRDRTWHFGGWPQDIVVAGDWNGDGKTKSGVLRGGVSWILDMRGTGSEEPAFNFGNFDGAH